MINMCTSAKSSSLTIAKCSNPQPTPPRIHLAQVVGPSGKWAAGWFCLQNGQLEQYGEQNGERDGQEATQHAQKGEGGRGAGLDGNRCILI